MRNIFFAQCHLKTYNFQFENEMRNSFLSFYKLNFYTHSHVFFIFFFLFKMNVFVIIYGNLGTYFYLLFVFFH